MNDGDGCAPVTLARNTPVAQAPGDLGFTKIFFFEVGGHGLNGFVGRQAVVFAGIDCTALLLVTVPVLPLIGRERFAVDGDDVLNGKAVFLGELEVAFVVGRHAHDGTVAIAHQHVVTYPQGNRFAGEWVDDIKSGCHAFFFAHG